MKIVSVTIAHNRETTIAGALACVAPFVDECLIVDTGITDATRDVAIETCPVPVYFSDVPWKNDFSHARNAALAFATERGATWAILIDTDQRIDWNGVDPRRFLDGLPPKTDPRVIMMRSKGGRYAKEQLLELPTSASYRGRTHECFPSAGAIEIPRARVWEVPKTPEEIRKKHNRDIFMLLLDIADDPLSGRAHFYLGEAYRSLDQRGHAAAAYAQAFACHDVDHAAWSAYKAAQLACQAGNYEEALAWCERGHRRSPARLELAAFAAWVCSLQEDYAGCLTWADRALAIGYTLGTTPTGRMRGHFFCDAKAYYDGPAGLAALAAGALGDTKASKRYEELRLELKKKRLALFPTEAPAT